MSLTPADERLTVVIPTHNRPERLHNLVRFLCDCNAPWKIVVADSSKVVDSEITKLGASNLEYRHYGDNHPIFSKLVDAVSRVTTPYAVMIPDDDITFPHALKASVEFLDGHPDFVVAYGYVLDFAIHEQTFDVTAVRWFTPDVDETDPMERMYQLVRRYQPFFWAVMRTTTLVASVNAGRAQGLIVFQEMAFMNSAIMEGKVARLPVIFNLRGTEGSMTSAEQTHPIFALLNDAENFTEQYAKYRNYLVSAILEKPAGVRSLPFAAELARFLSARPRRDSPEVRKLKQLIDMIHLTSFGRELDVGVVNHITQVLLGRPVAPYRPASSPYVWQPPRERDLVHSSRVGPKFVWRREVFEAEPKDEIRVTLQEVTEVEAQLVHYLSNER